MGAAIQIELSEPYLKRSKPSSGVGAKKCLVIVSNCCDLLDREYLIYRSGISETAMRCSAFWTPISDKVSTIAS